MVVDKTIEIDLNNLTPQALEQIDAQLEEVKNFFINPDNRSVSEKFTDPLLIPKSQKEDTLSKIFGRETFGNLLNFGRNPLSFLTGSVTRLIPFIGTALLVTGVIADFVKKVDDFQKEFVNNVDGRINLFRSREQQAMIQAGLTQLIITTEAGSAEPRDAYNTFTEFNTNQARIEADFKIRETTGVN
jgi:hypothetical protein